MAALIIFLALVLLVGVTALVVCFCVRLWTHRKTSVFAWIALAVVVAGTAFVGLGIYKSLNAEGFNAELAQKVESNRLIGKSESEVIAVLGVPSHRMVYRDGKFTLNYFPSGILPFNKFQAHFRSEGTLRSIELMD